MNIAFDSHKRYTLCSVASASGKILEEVRIVHERGAIAGYLSRFPAGQAVAVETIGSWYWIVDEIEAAGLTPLLVHARKAKLMMGCVNKTDRLDVRGLNRLQQAGTLPTVWIPPGELRDQRELTRSRIYLVAIRTRLKNRIHADLGKYGLSISGVDDIFGPASRSRLRGVLAQLPAHARSTAEEQLEYVDALGNSIKWLNGEIDRVLQETEAMQLLQTLPGIGNVLSKVVGLEIGDVNRFWSAGALASYAGTVSRVHASGGRVRHGKVRPDVNRYLKWAYAEAGNSIVINQNVYPDRHVTQLYRRVRAKRGHAKAIGAVSRHLAESSYWVLRKQEPYDDPSLRREMSTNV